MNERMITLEVWLYLGGRPVGKVGEQTMPIAHAWAARRRADREGVDRP